MHKYKLSVCCISTLILGCMANAGDLTVSKATVGSGSQSSTTPGLFVGKSLNGAANGTSSAVTQADYTSAPGGANNLYAGRSVIYVIPSANTYDACFTAQQNTIGQSGSYNLDATEWFPLRVTQSRLSLGGSGTIKGVTGYDSFMGLESSCSSAITYFAAYAAKSPYRVSGSSATISTAFGYYVDEQKQSFVTDAYGVYQAGANDKNYFNGKVGIGTTSPSSKLHVVGGVTFTSGAGGANQTVAWNPGDASWSFTSDRNTKDRVTPVDSQAVLEKVTHIPINEWSYIGYPQRHVGPMAQDFHAQFPLNENNLALNDADLHGVALAAIQGLNEKLEGRNLESGARLQKLETENAELKQSVNELKKLVEAMSREAKRGAH